MKHAALPIFGLIIAVAAIWPVTAEAQTLIERTKGHILLQVEDNGEAWYVNPTDKRRYYLGRPDDAFAIMRELGVGISTANLERIPTIDQTWQPDEGLMRKVRGKILLQVEANGEAWYVHPDTDIRYYLDRPADAFAIMRQFGVGALNAHLEEIPMAVPGDELAESVLLDIPFTSQAPYGDWSSPYDEACEEAILVMLDHYRAGTPLIPSQATNAIRDVVEWEKQHLGYHEDISADATARVARDYFGFNAEVYLDVSEESIKRQLNNNNPVLVPVYGKELGNPHFLGSGPDYHMVLIIGYENDYFITHEPGTQYGDGYKYNVDLLMDAIHDLTVPESAGATGRKAMIVVE